MIQFSQYLPSDEKQIVYDTIQRNGYFCHVENILLSMLNDEQGSIRELAIRRILSARSSKINLQRQFKIPEIKFDAQFYYSLIDWSTSERLDPPLLKEIDSDTLKSNMKSTSVPEIFKSKLPCHTQNVERHIKLVTEVSSNVIGEKKRDSIIKTKLRSRKVMPKFEKKSDFKICN